MTNRQEFIKLQSASFISQSGSHLLTIALAGFVFSSSGSVVQSSLIFVLSYMPSVFFSATLGNWIDQRLSRWLLARNELLSIATSILCGVCIALKLPLAVLCALVAIRSLLLFVARTAGTKWVKIISPPEQQSSRIKLFFLSFFLSTAIAGILASAILSRSTIFAVVAVDVVTYLTSLAIIAFLKSPSLPPVSSFPTNGILSNVLHATREICANQNLRTPFLNVCLSQALFQGAYSVLVSYLPISKLGLGITGVGVFQVAASLGITAGFLTLWLQPNFLQNDRKGQSLSLVVTGIIGIFSLLGSASVPSVTGSFGGFLLFHLAYECIWLSSNSEFFKRSPAESLGRYQFTLTSMASFLMALTTLLYSIAIQNLGLMTGLVSVIFLVAVSWIGAEVKSGEKKTVSLLAGRCQ